MPHRIVRQFLNDPRVIQRMAESWPIRRAARFSVSSYYKAAHKLETMQISVVPKRLSSFVNRFQIEYRKELEQQKK